jgi:hypothetical protein
MAFTEAGLKPVRLLGNPPGTSCRFDVATIILRVFACAPQSLDFVRFRMANHVTFSENNSISVVLERISNITDRIGGTSAR